MNHYETIATKVSHEQKQQLDLILQRLGMNYYQWFQLMAEVTIRIADDRHNLSDMMSKLIQMFQLVPGWKDPVTFGDTKDETEIHSALYFIKQKGKKGMKPVLTQRDWFAGMWSETENVQDIVEFVIEQCMPTSYKWLRQRMVELDCNRVFECLLRMADDATAERMNDEIAALFGDNSRHEWGKVIEYGNRNRRKKRRTVDSLANSQQYHPIMFDDDDRELADMEAQGTTADEVEDNIGCAPFGVEP